MLLQGTMTNIVNSDFEDSNAITAEDFKDIQNQLYELYMDKVHKKSLSEDNIAEINDQI